MNTIEEDNRLIAEFLGVKSREHHEYEMFGVIECIDQDDHHFYTARMLKFNDSWDWLMEVVEKIESLNYDFQILGGCWVIIDDVDPDRDNEEILEVSSETKIKSVYDACVAFIKWYNENKS